MCNIKNAAGYTVGDIVYVSHDRYPAHAWRVTGHGREYVDLEDEASGEWMTAWNDQVTRSSMAGVKAANGIGPGAGPGARLAATLRAIGKKFKGGK